MLTKILCPTIVSEGSHLQGELAFHCESHIYGTVEGRVRNESNDPLQIGKTGWVCGSIFSKGPVSVEGRVEGDIYCLTQITLLPTATVLGRLKCHCIRMEPGAYLDGEMQMQEQETAALFSRAA